MNDKAKIIAGFIGSVFALLGVVFFLHFSKGEIEPFYLFVNVAVIVLVIGATIIYIGRARDHKKGLPFEDEYTKRLGHKVGAYTYYATIWIAVAIAWYDFFFHEIFGLSTLTAGQAAGAVVLLSGIFYITLYFILRGRGETE